MTDPEQILEDAKTKPEMPPNRKKVFQDHILEAVRVLRNEKNFTWDLILLFLRDHGIKWFGR